MEIKILVIDDSAFSRFALRGLLEAMPGVNASVQTAVDGVDGYRQALRSMPDMIMLDLEMPNMDGFTFLRLLRNLGRVPVIVVTGCGWEGHALKAFELGAADFIEKPASTHSEKLFSIKDELVKKVKMMPVMSARAARHEGRKDLKWISNISFGSPEVIAIGASTGGPKSIASVIKMLPSGIPAAFVVSLHMPQWLTDSFVGRLKSESLLKVKTACDGDVVEKGGVLVAPGGHHISFVKRAGKVYCKVTQKSGKDVYAPSIDRMFTGAAEVWGAGAVGVIMTGMGSDGREGAINIKNKGGYVIAESRDSAIVSSMPDAAVSTGKVDAVLSSSEIGGWIIERCGMSALKLA